MISHKQVFLCSADPGTPLDLNKDQMFHPFRWTTIGDQVEATLVNANTSTVIYLM